MNNVRTLAAGVLLSAGCLLAVLWGQVESSSSNGTTSKKGIAGTVASPNNAVNLEPTGAAPPQNGILYHGGPVMLGPTNIYYIWYGNWSGALGNTATTVLQNLASKIGASPYFDINTTYTDGSNRPVGTNINFAGSTTDSYSQGASINDAGVQAIVASAISGNRLPNDPNGVYFVLASADVNETSGFCTKYCGWHTNGTIQGSDIKYAFIGNADRCPNACAAQINSPNGETGVDGMASIITHELEESATDPDLNAWYDAGGNESADKCAWKFGTTFTTSNGSFANITLGALNYLIQQEWVNASGGYCAMSLPPTLTLINPPNGAPGANMGVSLGGTNFVNPGANVGVSGTGVTPSGIAVVSPTQITATFAIAGNASTGARNVTVSTPGGTSGPVTFTVSAAGPAVNLSPSVVSFGNQTINTTSAPQTVTLTNNGPGLLTITGIALTGNNPGDYSQTNNCPISPATLAVNANCTFNVSFTPAATGSRTAGLTITDNGASSPQSTNLIGTGVAPAPTPWPNGYLYEGTFTVNSGKVPSAQSNFPGLISGAFPDFRTTANGGRIYNACNQAVGNSSLLVPCDLIFTSDAAGASPLKWEFESYGAATGAVNVWVNIPSLSNGSVVYAWYGNSAVTTLQTTPSATWNTNFEAVYHLKELPNGAAPQMNDSTINANHGTTNGGMPASQQVPGEIGGSLNFAGGNYDVTLANASNFSFERTDSFSVSCWVKPSGNTGGFYLSKQTNSAPVAGWLIQQFQGVANPTFAFDVASNGGSNRAQAKTTAEFGAGVWHYLVATWSGTGSTAGMNIYVDGSGQALTTLTNNLTGSIVNTITPQINGRSGFNGLTTAVVDECRVSTKGVVLSPDWVASSYNNQSSPATFFTAALGLTNSASFPVVTLSAPSLEFGNQTTNTTSASQSVTLTNNGPGTLAITGIAVTGANPGDYGQTNTCPVSPATLAVNAMCSISVTFTPTATGSRTASVSITDNGSGSPQSFTLSGTGVAPVPVVNLSPSSLTFGNQTTGTTSASQSVTLTNNGPGTLAITGIALAGANPGDYGQTNTCPVSPATLAVNAMCSISVTFTPTATGSRTASVSITDNGSGSPQSFTLSGTGVAPVPVVNLSPSSLAFGNQTTNTMSASQSVTLTNNGPGTLAITGIAVTGANPGDYGQTNTCPVSPATLAVNAMCSISVTFTPTATGSRTASVSVTDNGSGSPQSFTLSGTGVAPVPVVNLSPSSLTFGNQTTNTTSAAQSVTLTNNGPGTLAITGIAVTGANAGDYGQTNTCPVSPATLALNATCSISVKFTPTATGTRVASVSITDNGSGSPQSFGLSGTGVASGPSLWPNGYAYQATFTVAAGMVPSAQTNFPALISGTFSDFKTTANGGRIANTCTQTVGNSATSVPCDLIFTSDAAGTALLSWEFESYNAITGVVNIWVNVPTLNSGGVVYAWYGNAAVGSLQTSPASTWSSNFDAVYHLKELPNGAAPQMNDSTVNANHGTTNGGMPAAQQVPGEIGGSLNFAGGNYFVTLANASNFSFERTDSFSVSCWVKPSGNSGGMYLSKQTNSAPVAGWVLQQFAGGANPTFGFDLANNGNSNRAQAKTTAEFPAGVWHYVVATYSGTSTTAGEQIYVDGSSQALTTLTNNLTGSIVNTITPQINGRSGANALTAGVVDECRVSAKGTVLSPDWVTSSYNNQRNPPSFFAATLGLTPP